MPNGNYWLNEMEFERALKQMSDRDLLEFTARQTYSVCLLAQNNEKRISSLEKRNHRIIGTIGGIAGVIGAIIASAINYFVRS